MAAFTIPEVSPAFLAVGAIAVFLLHRIYWELTTGANRRRIVRQNGCEPAFKYPHKGIGGKLLGLDVMGEMIKSAKQGRMQESSRLRNWKDGRKTIQVQNLRRECRSKALIDASHANDLSDRDYRA